MFCLVLGLLWKLYESALRITAAVNSRNKLYEFARRKNAAANKNLFCTRDDASSKHCESKKHCEFNGNDKDRKGIGIFVSIVGTVIIGLCAQGGTSFNRRSVYAKLAEAYVPRGLSLRKVVCTPAACKRLGRSWQLSEDMESLVGSSAQPVLTAAII